MKTKKPWSILMMLVLVLSTTFAFSSCNKDDDPGDISGNLNGYLCGAYAYYYQDSYNNT